MSFLKIVFTRTLRDLMVKKEPKMRKNSKKDRENVGRVGLRSDDFYYKVESGENVRSYSHPSNVMFYEATNSAR